MAARKGPSGANGEACQSQRARARAHRHPGWQTRFDLRVREANVDLLLSLSMISAGVFLGTPTPYQLLAS
jgi:hypothetical protein